MSGLGQTPEVRDISFAYLDYCWSFKDQEESTGIELLKKSARMSTSVGTVVLTGANGSLGIAYVKSLLISFPNYTAILTVRDDSESDPNTQKLRQLIAKHPKAFIYKLDLASLSAVTQFSAQISSRVTSGELPPISAIVCNAFAWSLNTGLKFSADGYELSFQVCYLSHFALVLRLLGSMDIVNGRVVLLASDSHDPERKNALESYPVKFPDDPAQLAKPSPDKKGEEIGRGFQRYGLSKLCCVMFMYQLNSHLAQVCLAT